MSNTILNSDLSTKLEERLNSLITNHLKIEEPHLNDSASKKQLNKNLSSAMSVAGGLTKFAGIFVAVSAFMIAGRYGVQAVDSNLAHLADYALLAKGVGLPALMGAIGLSYHGLLKLTENIEEKVNEKLGFTTYSKTHKNLLKIEDDLGVEFSKEDLKKISSTLDEANIKQTMETAISNVRLKNK